MVLLPLGTFFGARWALDDDLVAAVIAAAVAQCIALGYAVFAYFDVPSEAPGRQAAVADASSAGPGEALVQPDTQSLRDGGARDKLKSI
ncbi:hypothetical protein FNF27_02401 [Cafeteria roenbergensis]|uniref:Uncharacterized protein n=2 Tax=Cafeteria roenbergensis TaxID=33653 RepID=A0A5A8C4U8_CAFRO|nr:hypothetical protein FNF29_07304 [Cafeteria roenbergensis]KAA0167505.1 hypothetical protein FNF31_00944 [Cafeteria roenbergensis]KAA0172418.1 hypothetical protein FNF28_00101 [Cafeteria roenbergensis]KAA0176009.1 hypothetical protein FNF27_02401 [Cafeteria roenbergensis]|eukprot:KAA0147559.1 hypothetical protein FNF29_07304 [Cafeteria roenbergensis]